MVREKDTRSYQMATDDSQSKILNELHWAREAVDATESGLSNAPNTRLKKKPCSLLREQRFNSRAPFAENLSTKMIIYIY